MRSLCGMLPLVMLLAGQEMPEPIVYTLSFPDAVHHYVEVEASFPTRTAEELTLAMAVWTPGSYLVREYARHLEAVEASAPGGAPLPVGKVTKNRWRVELPAGPERPERVIVSYRVYAREMTVRTNFVDGSFALLNGAPTFLTTVAALEGDPVPHVVEVVPPAGWSRVVSPLPPAPGAQPGEHRFAAADFDELVDSPLYLGNAPVHRFTVGGAEHLLVNEGEQPGVWDGPRSAADAEKIVAENQRLWQVVPYERYVFFNLLTGEGGGIEHKNSTVMMESPLEARSEEGWRHWLRLVSHEFFHTWNVKRLRPRALGPFDYEREVYTESLWLAEGVTSYYDDLIVHRAGLSTRERFLKDLGRAIGRLQNRPGRQVQSLAQASHDAWIKHYRQDENSDNSSVSYYNKGAVVAFLLDAEIRRATDGSRSLDHLLRSAYRRWAGDEGFTRPGFEALASEVAGTDLSGFFHHAVETTGELSYGPALDWLGLRFAPAKAKDSEEDNGDGPAAWLGADTEIEDGRLVVAEVPRETPAWHGGLQAEDEIVAVDGYRVPPRGLSGLLAAYRPGETVPVLVARRGRLAELTVTFGEKPEERWRLEVDPDATEEQRARLAAWLGGA